MDEPPVPSIQRYAFVALAAAALFGASAPAAKQLLTDIQPVALAGILYLGSGIGLFAVRRILGRTEQPRAEAPLTRRDTPWLAAAIACGGILAPVLLLWGLARSGAAEASLLLNLEGVLTTLLAAAMFREAIGARAWIATLLVVAGGLALGWQPGSPFRAAPPLVAIAGACLLWALDNNLTRRISAGDPLAIATAKGLVAGVVNLALAFATGALTGERAPSPATLGAGLLLGFASYGISLVLFIHALRHLGSARASAHFGTAPFFGAALSVALLGEPVTPMLLLALALMLAATVLLIGERHAHPHVHEPLVHSHRHVHDAHHRHAHAGDAIEPHVHEHRHEPIAHAHPHLPDLHHRHRHK